MTNHFGASRLASDGVTVGRAATVVVCLLLVAAFGTANVDIGDLQTKSSRIERSDTTSVDIEIALGSGELIVAGGSTELTEATFPCNVDDVNLEVSYKASGDRGTLSWTVLNQRWHGVSSASFTQDIGDLIDALDTDPAGIFWG